MKKLVFILLLLLFPLASAQIIINPYKIILNLTEEKVKYVNVTLFNRLPKKVCILVDEKVLKGINSTVDMLVLNPYSSNYTTLIFDNTPNGTQIIPFLEIPCNKTSYEGIGVRFGLGIKAIVFNENKISYSSGLDEATLIAILVALAFMLTIIILIFLSLR